MVQTYVFGETAYNIEKNEVSFAVDRDAKYDCASGLVSYASGDNTAGNSKGIDHYFDKVTTPAYAHTYLISSVFVFGLRRSYRGWPN